MSTILGLIMAGVKLVGSWFDWKKDESMKQAGRDEVRVEQGQQGLDAHKRMDAAAARPHDDKATEDNLGKGKF